jgi:hypothetical protein
MKAGQRQENWRKLAASPNHDKGGPIVIAEASVLPLACSV